MPSSELLSEESHPREVLEGEEGQLREWAGEREEDMKGVGGEGGKVLMLILGGWQGQANLLLLDTA